MFFRFSDSVASWGTMDQRVRRTGSRGASSPLRSRPCARSLPVPLDAISSSLHRPLRGTPRCAFWRREGRHCGTWACSRVVRHNLALGREFEVGVLSGKEIVLGVTGGIAAYKACEIIRELKGEGANVTTILTASGSQFLTPLTLQTLSKNPVVMDLWNLISESEIGHISLAQRAHLLLIAPATGNILGKIRGGIADDMLSTVVMATAAPVVLAPAMNTQMSAAAAVRENVAVLRSRGFLFVEPDEGELACGTVGPGRLAAVGKIVEMVRIVLAEKILKGKKVVVSAGPTAESIDPVRFLSNRASGKMGFALARAARRFGADGTLVSGPPPANPRTRTPS